MWDWGIVSGFADGTALVHELQESVCEILSLYMEKEDEVFKDYLDRAWESVWCALEHPIDSPSRKRFTVAAIRFFTIVVTSVHHEEVVFASLTIQKHVIPNVMWMDEDQLLFNDNPLEFIRRDMEGRNLGTRGRACHELLHGFERNYKNDTTSTVSKEIDNCLALFHENPNVNWKYKECAIYLDRST